MSESRGCDDCRVQLSLKEDFNGFDTVLKVKALELERKHCVNCADNSYATKHNWRAITKAQKRMLIKKYAPKEHQKRLLAELEKKPEGKG